ncbi:Protein of unknown function [Friedmanniella luteola]|uniref:Mannosyltransferase related to Gpi18 n=1 Tax=Friedmanniella luteola TaxID=546871 RepID=A0A1H1YY44_9ACTN|nr:glycosyltransferase 87 family protein [Friedmanniella luteola]SDT26328.1 Protein of unknown function [Friedmanniella luteola]
MTPAPTPSRRLLPPLVLAVLVAVALVVRWRVVDVVSADYRAFLLPWWTVLDEGGFAALAEPFSNYNTPYLVLLWLTTLLPVGPLVAVKALSVAFDLLLAALVHRITAVLRPGSRWLPVLAAGVVLLLPTVVLNSAAWGQCDAVYTAGCAASLLALLRRRPWLASALFGLAFAVKLQAVFFLPVLVVVLVLNRHRLTSLLAAPAAFLAALVPARVAGRGLLSQLAVYPAQVTNSSGAVGAAAGRAGAGGAPSGRGGFGGGGGGTGASSFTYNAPTPYAWLPSGAGEGWKVAGLVLAGLVALGFGIWLLRRRRRLDGSEVLLVAATATLVVPLLLPDMHERYFSVAEVLAVVTAVAVDRRFAAVAVLLQVASTSTYLSYLADDPLVPLRFGSMLAAGAAITASVVLVQRLGPGRPRGSSPVLVPLGAAAG